MPRLVRSTKLVAPSAGCLSAMVVACASPVAAIAEPPPAPAPVEQSTRLSSFGERAAFSPDGTRIAFVGRSYGDVFEIELATGIVRNVTKDVPNQGFLRVQYLPNGDYLLSGPRRYIGANSRVQSEMWILRKDLRGGLQPLGEHVFEGVALSRQQNLISWTTFDPPLSLKPDQPWMNALQGAKMRRYIATIVENDGHYSITDKREVMPDLPLGCGFMEPQDFRDRDRELLFYCGSITPEGGHIASVMGYNFPERRFITYRNRPDEYDETEGVSPDGTWTTVECGIPKGPGSPPIDICRLELVPGGQMSRLVVATKPGSTRKVSNPVVSPDGKWIAFQLADMTVGEMGEGQGIYLMRIAK